MNDVSFHLAAEISSWPAEDALTAMLRDAGLRVVVGRYSIRVDDCNHFVFQELGGDVSPSIDADAPSLETMIRDGQLVSDALGRARVRHRFEIYNSANQLVGYLHHDWPVDTK